VDLPRADEVEDAGEAPGEASDCDAVARDVLAEAELVGAEDEHGREGSLGEQPARVDFAEEKKELGIEHVGALEAEAGVAEQLGVGEMRESHAQRGTTQFFEVRGGPLERERSAKRRAGELPCFSRRRGEACAEEAFPSRFASTRAR
jgi:hypothetical protein